MKTTLATIMFMASGLLSAAQSTITEKYACPADGVISESDRLLTYDIRREYYGNLPVFALNGGMSAEYAVQKSLSNLCAGISHTWDIGPGGGPFPVWGTPDFLLRSVRKTVALYDDNLGRDFPVETVVIGTGVPSASYLTGAMGAVFLPSHFLASVNTVREVADIVSHGTATGYPCYATLGYDASMTGVGVAWIKLLELPWEYLDFIERHNTRNVIILGVGENVAGESLCRRVKDTGSAGEPYLPGSVYIQYTNHGSEDDIRSISSGLKDYDAALLDDAVILADWESGITERQISGFASSVKKHTRASVFSLVAPDNMMDMYDLAVSLSLEFMFRNRIEFRGICFNEYLISQPLLEMANGVVPLLYWQFNPASSTVSRLDNDIVPAVQRYFPDMNVKEMQIQVNARIGRDAIVGELRSRGYSDVTARPECVEEVWDMSDGINAPCELAARKLYSEGGAEGYENKVAGLKYLGIDDILRLESGGCVRELK